MSPFITSTALKTANSGNPQSPQILISEYTLYLDGYADSRSAAQLGSITTNVIRLKKYVVQEAEEGKIRSRIVKCGHAHHAVSLSWVPVTGRDEVLFDPRPVTSCESQTSSQARPRRCHRLSVLLRGVSVSPVTCRPGVFKRAGSHTQQP